MNKHTYTVISLYKFFEIKKVFNFKNRLMKILKNIDAKGIVLLAPEGININISIATLQHKPVLEEFNKLFKIGKDELKILINNKHIFKKLKIKIKKEILTTRNTENINPLKLVGEYVDAKDWDKLISDPNTILLDMRNDFETKIGTFNNSINPKCTSFTGLLKWLQHDFMNKKNIKNKKVAMFCTGGIRCEKASSFLLSIGKKNVYLLNGGILKYLEHTQNSKSWRGECFVFDDRVSLNKKLEKGSYDICHACRMPLSSKDKNKKEFIEGESCHMCYNTKTNAQRNKYRIRNKQIRFNKQDKI